jgi:hypothetical protein
MSGLDEVLPELLREQLVSLDPQVQQLLQNLQAEHDAQLRVKDALIARREHEAAFKVGV